MVALTDIIEMKPNRIGWWRLRGESERVLSIGEVMEATLRDDGDYEIIGTFSENSYRVIPRRVPFAFSGMSAQAGATKGEHGEQKGSSTRGDLKDPGL